MNSIFEQGYNSAKEIIEKGKLKKGNVLVIGCSTSEVLGDKIGTHSSPETAEELFKGIKKATDEAGVWLYCDKPRCITEIPQRVIATALPTHARKSAMLFSYARQLR